MPISLNLSTFMISASASVPLVNTSISLAKSSGRSLFPGRFTISLAKQTPSHRTSVSFTRIFASSSHSWGIPKNSISDVSLSFSALSKENLFCVYAPRTAPSVRSRTASTPYSQRIGPISMEIPFIFLLLHSFTAFAAISFLHNLSSSVFPIPVRSSSLPSSSHIHAVLRYSPLKKECIPFGSVSKRSSSSLKKETNTFFVPFETI